MVFNIGVLEAILRVKDQLSPEMGKVVASVSAAADKMTVAGTAMTAGITAPIVGVGVASVKAFGDFDDAMTKSLAIMGDVSAEMRGEMSDAAREVGLTTTFSAKQAADAYFFLASAGLDAAQSIEAMPRVAAFATAGNFDLAKATDLLTDAQSALGLTIRDDVAKNMENMARVSDVLVKANTLSNATVEQFSESLTNKAGPALRSVGKDIEEGVAVLAVFADQGIKGAEAGTQLGIVMRDLQTKAIENKPAFQELGVNVFDSAGEMRNMADIVADLDGLLAGMSDEVQKATLLQLGFSDKSVAALMALLGTSNAIRGYEAALRDAGGITREVAEKQLQSFWSQLRLVWSAVQDVGIEIGGALVPAMQALLGPAQALIGWAADAARLFTQLPTPIQATVIVLLGIFAAGGPVLIGIGLFTKGLIAGYAAVVAVNVAAATLGNTIPVLTARIWLMDAAAKAGWASLLGPIALIVAALAGLSVAIAQTEDRWTQFFLVAIPPIGFMRLQWEKFRDVMGDVEAPVVKASGAMARMAAEGITPITTGLEQATGAGVVWGDGLSTAASVGERFKRELQDIQNAVRHLDADQRTAILSLDEMGKSTKEIATQLHLAEAVVEGFKAGVEKSTRATADARKVSEDFAKQQREYYNWVGMRVIEAEGQRQQALEDTAAAYRKFMNDVGVREMENEAARLVSIERQEAANRAYYNWLGERRMQDEAAALASANAVKDGVVDVISSIPDTLSAAFTGGGGLGGAFKSIGAQLAKAIGEPLVKELTKVEKAAVGAGATASAALGSSAAGGLGATVGSLAGGLGGAALAASGWGTAMSAAGMAGTLALGAATLGIGAAAVGVAVLISKWAGVSKEVKKAREELQEFQHTIAQHATVAQVLEAGNRRWALDVIVVRDAFIALGRSEAEALAVVEAMWDTSNPERSAQAIAEVSAAFQQLEADNKRLTAAMDKYGFAVEEMGQKFKQTQINTTAGEFIEDFRVLAGAVDDVNLVLERMAPEVNEFILTTMKMGGQVPLEMQPIVQKMIELGLLTQENGEKFTDLGQIPFAESLVASLTVIADKLDQLITRIGLDLPRVIQSIPDAEFNINARVNMPDLPDVVDIPGFRHGSGGIRDFGPRGTLAVLHGREEVRTEEQKRAEERQRFTQGATSEEALRRVFGEAMDDLRHLIGKTVRDASLGAA